MSSMYKSMLGRSGNADQDLATPDRMQGTHSKSMLVIDLDRLHVGDNVRRDIDPEAVRQIAESLRLMGQKQPISVRWDGSRWEIVAGQTRYLAAKSIGMASLQCVVDDQPMDESTRAAVQLVENTARRDMSDLDTARAIRGLMDHRQCTAAEAASICGRSESWVSRKLALLKLPEAEQAKLATGKMAKLEARAAVVKTPKRKGKRRQPLRVKLTQGSITVEITWRKQADQTTAAAALLQLAAVAEQWDADQRAKEAA